MRVLAVVALLLLLLVPLGGMIDGPWCPECDLSAPSLVGACLLLVASPVVALVFLRSRVTPAIVMSRGRGAASGIFRPPRS